MIPSGVWKLLHLGNVLAPALGYSMAHDRWLQIVTGLWLISVGVLLGLSLPAIRPVVAIAKAAAGGGGSDGYDVALGRWRLGNVWLGGLYLALLALMAFPWRS